MIKKRNDTYDLIKVVAIFSILCGHMYTFANFNDIVEIDTGVGFYISHILKAIGLVENNIFFLITGIYSISSNYKEVLKKVLNLYLKIYVVSVLFFLFFFRNLSTDLILVSFAPFSMNSYWFLSVFIVVLLLSPFINTIWNMVDKKYSVFVYSIFFLLIVLIPSIFGQEKVVNGGQYSVAFGVFLFITGKIISEFGGRIKRLNTMGSFAILTTIVILYNTIFKLKFGRIELFDRMLDGSNKLIPFFLSVLVICFATKQTTIFKSIRVKKFIALTAKSSLMIYIVHCNKYFIRFVFPIIREIWEKTEIHYVIYIVGVAILLTLIILVLNYSINKSMLYLLKVKGDSK